MKNNRLMLVIFLTVFIDVIGLGIIIPLLPFYAEKFGASPKVITLLFSSFSLMQLLFAPFWGLLSDRLGRRPILLLSISGSCISYLWCGFANSLWMLFASRLLAGFMGGTIVTAQAYVSDITTPENRAKGMGMVGASLGLGFTFGPAIGGFLASINPEEVNYQLPLFAAAGLSLLGFIFAFFNLPKIQSSQKKESRKKSFVTKLNNLVLTLQSPLINTLIFLLFLINLGLLGAQTTLALWLERQFNWGPQETGYTLMFCAVVATILQGGMIGTLTKKFGEVNLLISGVAFLGMGLFLLPFSSTVILLLGAVGFQTIGECLSKVAIRSILSQLAQANQTGIILGIAQSFGSLGTILGPALAGFIFVEIGKDSPFFNGAILMGVTAIICCFVIQKLRLELRLQKSGAKI